MSALSRRELCQQLPLLALLPALAASAQPSPQTATNPEPTTPAATPEPTAPDAAAHAAAAHESAASNAAAPDAVGKSCAEPLLTRCQAFALDDMPLRHSADGAPTRQILEGRIPGMDIIELHETTLAPGTMPHPAHRHPHAELLLVREGTLEFQSEGAPTRLTAGGAAYCAPNQLHGFRNTGNTTATYFILKIGAQPICQK